MLTTTNPLSQRNHRRRLEDIAHGDGKVQFFADARGHLRRDQRIAPDVEEGFGRADPVQPGHIGDDPGERRFEFAARGDVVGDGGDHRIGQCRAVELAVHVERQGVDDDHEIGHHVAREPGGDVAPQMPRVDLVVVARPGDDVADQLIATGRRGLEGGRGRGDAPGGQQRRLDLAELDPEPAQLDLRVAPAAVLEGRAPADPEVAGSVHARTVGREGVGDESVRRESGTAVIAAGHLRSAHIDLALDPVGHRIQPLAEDVQRQTRQAVANVGGHRLGDEFAAQGTECGVHRGLGGSIGVDQHRSRGPRLRHPVVIPAPDLKEVQRLAGEDDIPHAAGQLGGRRRRHRRGQLVERRRRLRHDRGALGGDERGEIARAARGGVVDDHQTPTEGQGAPHLEYRHVEGVGVKHRPHVGVGHLVALRDRGQQGDHAAVLDDNAFGDPGRPGGVDQVGDGGARDGFRLGSGGRVRRGTGQ